MEHKSTEYQKINPLGQVPALCDGDDICIFDSHAIIIYLVEKYAKDDSLYPKDIVKRAKINQMLFFDATILFLRYYEISIPLFKRQLKEFSKEGIGNVIRAYDTLEGFFNDDQKYVYGNEMTIADISIWSMMLSLKLLVPLNDNKFPKISKWLQLMQKRPTFELNQNGAVQHSKFIKSFLNPENS
jgi:glutathione S-transferase